MMHRYPRARAAARLGVLVGAMLIVQPARAQVPPTATSRPVSATSVVPAIDGVLDAFRSRPLVGIGDAHGLAQELDLYAAIVRDPRFAAEVGNVVVEFGGAAHQDIIDRFVAGESVPYVELRKVWTDTVGWIPVVSHLGFMNFFAQVRATNMTLPAAQQIRVWLGEPPIDWSKVTTRADLTDLLAQRDRYPADVIRREILAKNKKALVIYGTAHFLRERDNLQQAIGPRTGTEAAVRRLFTGLAEGAPPYDLLAPELAREVRTLESRLKTEIAGYGALRSLVFKGTDLRGGDVYDLTYQRQKIRTSILLDAGGKIEGATYRPVDAEAGATLVDEVEARQADALFVVAPYTGFSDKTCAQRFENQLRDRPAPALLRDSALVRELRPAGCREAGALDVAEAVLFLGPPSELTVSPTHPDIYLDDDYRREIGRRYQILTGRPFAAALPLQNVTAAPRKYRP